MEEKEIRKDPSRCARNSVSVYWGGVGVGAVLALHPLRHPSLQGWTAWFHFAPQTKLIALVEDALLNVWPKFLESIDRHAPGEALRRAQERVLRVGFTGNAPGV